MDEAILLFEEKIISKQHISKKHKCFCTTIYKVSGITGYTYNMSTYMGKATQNATWTVTATHATVNQSVTRNLECKGH